MTRKTRNRVFYGFKKRMCLVSNVIRYAISANIVRRGQNRKVVNVTFPRSGHYLLSKFLLMYFGRNINYAWRDRWDETGQREFDMARSRGLKTSTTTRCGNIYYQHKDHLECLPRVMLTENSEIKDVDKIRRRGVVTA